jgi:diguanylate cyclase (GGDEF)-like protein
MTGRVAARRMAHVRAGIARRLSAISVPEGRVAVVVWTYLVAGVAVVAATMALFPVSHDIAPPFEIAGIDPRALGIGLWIVVGVATSARGTAEEGRTAITLGVAPVVAAFALGGPAAGVLVGAFGSLEARELRGEIPWYAVLANRAVLAIPAGFGGILTFVLRGLAPSESQLGDFLEVMAGAAVFCAGNLLLAVLAVWARTGRRPVEAVGVPWRTITMMMVAESTLAWIFAAAYAAIAWWSPAGLVIADAAASASVDRGRAGWLLRHNQLTLLPNRLSLTEHAADLRRSGRSGACVFYIDLDGFKAVNDTYDHAVGDDVLKMVGRRLMGIRRRDDFLAHLHGDEFVLLAAGVESEADAASIVARVTEVVEEPIEHEVGTLRVSATVGYRILRDVDELDEALRLADRGMAAAKRERRRRIAASEPSVRAATVADERPVSQVR